MSAEKETLRRVQDGLFHLQKGLAPFVEARMKGKYGTTWLHYASRAAGGSPNAKLDAYGLLKTLIDNWRDVFDDAFGRADKHKARNFASMALEARNAISHLAIGLQDDEALRYLDAMHQLLKVVKAPAAEVSELKRFYDEQRKSGIASTPKPAAVPVSPPPAPQPKLELPVAEPTARALKPWTEIALPHPDVLANRFKEAEFAADLFAVDSGNAGEDYGTPENFFRITFLTEGLRRVLTSSLQRLARSGGDPVIGLQTAFGGGKTHTMLAVYHLARSNDLKLLEGIPQLAEHAGVAAWKKPKLAAFVGSAKGTDVSLILKDGPKVHTLWGFIAWRLAGEEGLKLVADAEAARTNPGSELILEVLKRAGPSVILLDELVAFARQLPDDRFEAFLSFIQSLTEAAKMAPGALVIGSLPESKSEAGGPKGEAALARLEKVFGRVQSPWIAAHGNETYEIIRRRLFQTMDGEGEKAREETIKAFHDLYKKNSAEFPPEAKEARYLELLRLSYPIHPELFDRLSKDWAALPLFQRTRGVLRFMANVVGVLWHQQCRDPLITPARIPLTHGRVRASVLYPLSPAYGPIVDREVDGEGSLAAQIEANPTRRISQARAATRAGRAVFLCSAPLVDLGQPNAGLSLPGVRLACAEPGDQIAIFGEALHELAARSAFLYEEAGRFWFSTHPTLNREADNRAKALPEHEVDAAIVELLREEARSKGGFHRVHAAPDDPIAIDEAASLSLVILGPAMPHAGKGVSRSRATEAVTDTLMRCRASQRAFRNTLIFVAADEGALATARDVMRNALAWRSIVDDDRLQQQLTQAQVKDAAEKARTQENAALKAVRAAWSHIFYPIKSETAGVPFDLEHDPITARDRNSIPVTVYDKAKADGITLEKLGTERLWLALKPIWPDDRPHLAVSEVAEWFSSYVYLPKLRDGVVLQAAIRESVAKLDPTFGYASGHDVANGRYQNLVWGRNPPDVIAPTALIVRASEALDQLKSEPKEIATPPDVSVGPLFGRAPAGLAAGAVKTGQPELQPRNPARFYGSVEIDMVRPIKAFDAIFNAVVVELQRTQGAKVKLTLEIEAEAPKGFGESDVSVVRDNARQLKFKAESTGFE